MLNNKVNKTKAEEYDFILKLVKKCLQLLSGTIMELDFIKVLQSCADKKILAYKLFYYCGWEDLASLCTQNLKLFEFFDTYLPLREKEFFIYLSKIIYYKYRGKQEYCIIKQKFLKALKNYIILDEITNNKEVKDESVV